MSTEEARAAAKFARVTPSKGSVSHKVEVPGHEGRHYLVLIRHETRAHVDKKTGEITKFNVVTGECLLDTGKFGTPPACPSTSSTNSPCFHALAGVLAIANSQGLDVAFASNQSDAQRVKNLHAAYDSKMFRVAQHDSYKYCWVVTWKKE